jgi:hypothetical protein
MTRNMGSIDRVIRGIIGVVLLIAAFTAGWSGFWTAVAGIVGIVLIGTAVTAYCPPYQMLGINTFKRRDS